MTARVSVIWQSDISSFSLMCFLILGKIPEESIAMQYVSPVVPAMGAGSEVLELLIP